MFLQKSINSCSVHNFEENGLSFNYQFSSILSKKTPKFEAGMNIYFWI